MRRSWMTPGSGKPQESFKNDPTFELSSIIRSFTKNPISRLSRQPTFCNEPGPNKSLSDIVNRLTNSIESNKSLTDRTRNLLLYKQNSQFDNEGEMSRTESEIYGLSPGKTSERRSRCEKDLRMIKSVDQFESSRLLSSRINENFDVISMRSSMSRSRMSSTVSINFEEELWPTSPTSLNTSRDISKLFSNSLNCQGLRQVAERLEDFIPTRDNDSQEIKNNYKDDNVDSAELNKIDLLESNEELKNEEKDEIIDLKRKKSRIKMKLLSRRKSVHGVIENKPVIIISPKKNPSDLIIAGIKSKQNIGEIENMKILIKEAGSELKENNQINYEESASINDSSIDSVVNSLNEQQKSEISIRKNTKYDQIKSRYTSGISGGLKACAKQSKMMIPQSKRLRALFQPMAGIQEPLETNLAMKKGKFDRKSREEERVKTASASQAITGRLDESNVVQFRRTSSIDNPSKFSTPKFPKKRAISLIRSKTFLGETKTRSDSLKKIDEKINETLGVKIVKEDCIKEEPKKKINHHTNSLKILKEILSYEEEKEPNKKSRESSEESSINSKTLLEKLASLSESSDLVASLTSDDDDEIKEEEEQEEEKKLSLESNPASLKVDTESQTPKKCEKNQNLQTDIVEINILDKKKINACTRTEIDQSLTNKNNVDVKVDKKIESRVNQTQTSSTSLQHFRREKRDASMETIKLRVKCQQVNTERKIMIDTASGVFRTDNSSTRDIASQSDCSHVEVRADKIFVHPSAINFSSCDKLVSSFSRELKSSKKCLEDCCEKFSSKIIEQQKEMCKIPMDVIKAFELAAERAQNLHRAIEIYHQSLEEEMKNQKTEKLNSDNFIFKRDNDCWTIEESSESLVTNKILRKNLEKLMIQQEVQIVIENILDQVERVAKNSRKKPLKKINKNTIEHIDLKSIIEFRPEKFSSYRRIVLSIIYGAICLFVFWSLQFSISCEY